MEYKKNNKLIWELYGYLSIAIVLFNIYFKPSNSNQGKIWLSYGLLAILINLGLKLN
tara:strand:+ start:363 stop:533 length:171 start_codon:yes stop_codon:yes gene_type:complete